jgi:hypothetical protein
MYMPTLLFQVVTIVFNLIILVLVAYYILDLRSRKKFIEERERKLGTDHKQIVESGLSQERQMIEQAVSQSNQIMQVATHQANQILAGTQYISQSSKASLDVALQRLVVDAQNSGSSAKIALDQALQKIIVDVHREAFNSGQQFSNSYNSSLKQISTVSLNSFQTLTGSLELELQQQIRDFRAKMLDNLEKEVEDYKKHKIQRIEQASTTLVQRVAQETLNKTLSVEDQHALLIQSLERAKREGVFD